MTVTYSRRRESSSRPTATRRPPSHSRSTSVLTMSMGVRCGGARWSSSCSWSAGSLTRCSPIGICSTGPLAVDALGSIRPAQGGPSRLGNRGNPEVDPALARRDGPARQRSSGGWSGEAIPERRKAAGIDLEDDNALKSFIAGWNARSSAPLHNVRPDRPGPSLCGTGVVSERRSQRPSRGQPTVPTRFSKVSTSLNSWSHSQTRPHFRSFNRLRIPAASSS
jgi:hypothetical protein